MVLQNWPAWLRNLLLQLTGIGWAVKKLREFQRDSSDNTELLERCFQLNHYDVQVFGDERFPTDRGSVIVANHPHGFLDGLGIIWLGSRHGVDTRAITRHFSTVFEPIKDWFLFVKTNHLRVSSNGADVVAQSADFVASGGCLAICASGRIATSEPFWAKPKELSWKTGAMRIAQQAQAPIVLVHIEMRRSKIRQLLHNVNPIVRSIFQIYAIILGRRQFVHLYVLDIIEPNQVPAASPQQQTQWLRQRYDRLLAELLENNGLLRRG